MAPRTCNVWLLSCLALCSHVLGGCSDDDEGDGGRERYVIDLDGTTGDDVVVDLSDDQLGEICASFDAYFTAEIDFGALSYAVCLPGSIVGSQGNPDECGRLLDECMGLFPEPIEIDAHTPDNRLCIEGLRGCNASIRGLEGCVNLNLGALVDILDNWSCEGADSDRMRQASKFMDTINVCADANASCGLDRLPAAPF